MLMASDQAHAWQHEARVGGSDGILYFKTNIFVFVYICAATRESHAFLSAVVQRGNGSSRELSAFFLVCVIAVFVTFVSQSKRIHILYRFPLIKRYKMNYVIESLKQA